MRASVYLCGPEGSIPEGQRKAFQDNDSWRSAAFHFCLKHGMQVLNPLAESKRTLQTNGRYFIAGERSRKEVETALSHIDRADFVLANLYNRSESALIPMVHAYQRGKQVVAWSPFPVSPWLASYTQATFERLDEALEYMLSRQGQDHQTILQWSLQYENGLKITSDMYPSAGEPDFHYFPGENRILLLSPHATTYWHLGALQEAESYTGALAAAVARLTGSHALVNAYCNPEDSLYAYRSHARISTDPMLEQIRKLVEVQDIDTVIVVRGTSWSEERVLHVSEYLPNSEAASNDLVDILSQEAPARGIAFSHSRGSSSSLRDLCASLGTSLLEIYVHKSHLIPQMQRASYHNVMIMLEYALVKSDLKGRNLH